MKLAKTIFTLAFLIFELSLFAQDAATNAAPLIPEAAREHFVMGTTLYSNATSVADFKQAADEFQQAADLAPQWSKPRYNLAWAKEAAEDYAGAIADLKRYQQFNLPEAEARAVQDKIYVIKAKLAKAEMKKGEAEKVTDAEQSEKDKQEATMNAFVGDWVNSYQVSSYRARRTFSIKRSDDGSFTIRFVNTGMNADISCQDVKFDGSAIYFKMDSSGHKLILNKNGCLILTYYGNNNGLDSSPGYEFCKE